MRADKDLSCDSLLTYRFEGPIDTKVVTECFELLAKKVTKETWVIVDNAPQHTSKLFKSYLNKWSSQGLNVKFLPPYSPELNKIEILWRFIKYQWLKITLGMSYVDLNNALDQIIVSIGSQYHINFS